MVQGQRWRLFLFLPVALVAGWLFWQMVLRDGADEDHLVLYGNVDIREVSLAFNSSEHIAEVLVEEGDTVEKGQLLASLHQQHRLADVAVAEARLAAQQAVVDRLVAGSRPEEVRQARARLTAARARLRDEQRRFQRIKGLFDKHSVSRQTLDDAEAAVDVADAELKVAQETLALLLAGPREEDIRAAKALLQADEAQLQAARESLADTRLLAPSDGVIRNRILEPGDMATPQTPVLTLALLDPLWVRSYAPETVLGRLKPGMAAVVTSDSHPDKQYPAWLGFVSSTAEFTPKNVETPELRTRLVYQIRVFVCEPRGELRLGMPATVTFDLSSTAAGEGRHRPSGCGRS